MFRKWMSVCFLLLVAAWVPAANKDDWEEVNFVFNSHVIVDGFPSMLRLAEVLSLNPDQILVVRGHADATGKANYNDNLARKRAEAVRDFLVKYGAKPAQIEVESRGQREPKETNATREGRFMNRRVEFFLYLVKDGKRIQVSGASPISGILKDLDQKPVLDRLDELARKQDAILDRLKKLDDLDKLQDQLKALQDRQSSQDKEMADLKDRLAQAQKAAEPVKVVATTVPIAEQKAGCEEKKGHKTDDLTLLGLDLGTTREGDLTGSVSARYMHRFSANSALQAQGEFLAYPDRTEIQADAGLVRKYKFFQIGAFASAKRVEMDQFQNGGTLAQGTLTAEVLFSGGSVGGFATHGLQRQAVVNRQYLTTNLVEETYLETQDQYGMMLQLALPAQFWMEANAGWINRGDKATKLGGLVRFVRPIGDRWSWFVEGGLNETLLSDKNSARFAAGVRYGLWKQPARGAVPEEVQPMEVPRVRYDVRTRQVRVGNGAPVANAGPDLVNVEAATIHLDGTGSYDPDGDQITYQWTQVQGPAVTLQGASTPSPSFAAAAGQIYGFRLRVADPTGAFSQDDVVISTRRNDDPQVLFFLASPEAITRGEKTSLRWKVSDADTVTIEGIGAVQAEGSLEVAPVTTTEYVLVARRGERTVRSTVQVVVRDSAAPQILFFVPSPGIINQGEKATLRWKVINATTITLEGVGTVQAEGSLEVAPSTSTNYVLVAGADGREVRATAQLIVRGTNTPPVADAGHDMALNFVEGRPVTLDASGSYDPDGDAITFEWRQIGGPAVTIVDPHSAVTSFVPPVKGTYMFSVLVRDARGAASDARVTIGMIY